MLNPVVSATSLANTCRCAPYRWILEQSEDSPPNLNDLRRHRVSLISSVAWDYFVFVFPFVHGCLPQSDLNGNCWSLSDIYFQSSQPLKIWRLGRKRQHHPLTPELRLHPCSSRPEEDESRIKRLHSFFKARAGGDVADWARLG